VYVVYSIEAVPTTKNNFLSPHPDPISSPLIHKQATQSFNPEIVELNKLLFPPT